MTETILYLECSSGISGDMSVAALLDLGADRKALTDALESLPLSGYSIKIKDVSKSGICACDFDVVLEYENHDHDMPYLHGSAPSSNPAHNAVHGHDAGSQHKTMHTLASKHSHETMHAHNSNPTRGELHLHGSDHSHGVPHPHDPDHSHGVPHPHDLDHSHESLHTHGTVRDQGHAHHHHEARNLNDIIKIIQAGKLTDRAKELSIRIFRIIAEAEASVHGKSIEEVHFHEVGAVDSIVDIVAFAVCLDNLHPDRIVVSALTDGTGQIRCQHGLIPVPVPAVAAIAENHSLTLKISPVEGELVTPTGAAIAAALASEEKLPAKFQILKTGFGAGKRDYATSGFLRAMLLTPQDGEQGDTIVTLETNIDDCTGEALSYTMHQLLEAGALDVFFIPIYMKKNRPAQLLKVICKPDSRRIMESIIFRNTTTIGIRVQEMQRTKLSRHIIAVETPWGMADVKCCTCENDTYYYPENDSVCHLAQNTGYGFSEMYGMIQSYAREHM